MNVKIKTSVTCPPAVAVADDVDAPLSRRDPAAPAVADSTSAPVAVTAGAWPSGDAERASEEEARAVGGAPPAVIPIDWSVVPVRSDEMSCAARVSTATLCDRTLRQWEIVWTPRRSARQSKPTFQTYE